MAAARKFFFYKRKKSEIAKAKALQGISKNAKREKLREYFTKREYFRRENILQTLMMEFF